jgi:hypothetical protein
VIAARPRAGALIAALPPGTRSPAESYVAGLAPGSRRAQAQALVRIAGLLGSDDPRAVAWWKLTDAEGSAQLGLD